MKGSNKANKNITGSTGPCKGCEDDKPIDVVNQFIVEETIISEGNSSPETDEDIFE